jgi:CheY-like chemotaxis protein
VLRLVVDAAAGACVSLRLEVHNAAGVGHARLVGLGEREFNRIAKAEGERAHTDLGSSTSAGDGFPIACTCARLLGGELDLSLDAKGVTAVLHLFFVARAVAARTDARMFATMPLRCAMVDDSAVQRKMLRGKCKVAFPQATFAVVAGENAASIRGFARRVVDEDCDVVFVDQDFGDVLETMFGIDVVAAIRQLDYDAVPRRPARQRLVFIVSGSESPSDIELYANIGADGHIGKDATAQQLQQALFAANADLCAPARPDEEPDV